jgi:hypothetical protein
MLTASTSVLPHDSFNYSAEDLEVMRHAFRRACDENPLSTKTEAQCYNLAKAIVNRYQHGISETELIAIALRKAH